ncbi:MAG: hypothetical protein CME61_05840 [Halobacteriovoraceae bacterium]|nr:hypothetical protein [Halobacteriovoraceae bacterium]
MCKIFSTILLTLTLISCATSTAVNYEQEKSDYKNAAVNLVSTINSISFSKKAVMKQSLNAVEMAKPLIKRYAKKYPKCTILTDFILMKEKEILNSKPEQLESDYHEGNILPEFDSDCHDIKEVVVHPATVYSLAKYKNLSDSKEQMLDEMEEVLMHLDSL